jgi:hypothetical protein
VTPAEAQFWERVMARAARQRPAMIRAITQFIDNMRARLTDEAAAALVQSGMIDEVVNGILSQVGLDTDAAPVRAEMLNTVQQAARVASADLPNGAQRIAGAFNVLDPRIIESIRALDTKVIDDLKRNARIVVRNEAENAIRLGKNPREIAARLRAVVGLGETQREQVNNYRNALESGDWAKARTYIRRDRRYERLMTGDKVLTPAQVNKMVAAYTGRRIGLNAESVARTAVMDAQKMGQEMAVRQAIEAGFLDGARMVKTWVTVGDDRVRDEHYAMEGETVKWDEPFSNFEMVAGESTYNCRCVVRYTQDRAGRSTIGPSTAARNAARNARAMPASPSVPVARPPRVPRVARVANPPVLSPAEFAARQRAATPAAAPTGPTFAEQRRIAMQQARDDQFARQKAAAAAKSRITITKTPDADDLSRKLFGKQGVQLVDDYTNDVFGVDGLNIDEVKVSSTYSDELYVSSSWSSHGATLSRSFGRKWDGKLEVHHDLFKLPDSARGSGVGAEVIARSMAQYKKMGVDKVTMLANLDVGGYVWARMGYVPESPRDWKRLAESMKNGLSRYSPKTRIELRAILDDPDPKAIWRLSDHPNGKELLLDTNWHAVFDMSDRAALQRLADAVARGKAKRGTS